MQRLGRHAGGKRFHLSPLPHGNPTPEKTAAVVSNANYCSVYKAASI
jgi:hypothetical protein